MSALFLGNLIHLGVALAVLGALVVVLHVLERVVSRHVAHHLGWHAVLITGWLGVPLHELSHLAFAKLFGHRLIAWKLLDPDPVTGTLGYVRHAYCRRNLWQLGGTLFIGLAPLLAGGASLALLLGWMLPAAERHRLLAELSSLHGGAPELVWQELLELTGSVGAALWRGRTVLLPVQLYLAVCVAHHMAPSPADLRGALPGLMLLLAILVVAAAGAAAAGRSLLFVPALVAPMILVLPITTALLTLWAMLAGLLGRMQQPLRGRASDS